MARLLFIIAIGGLVWYWWTHLRGLPEAERHRRLWQLGAWGAAGVLLLLILTGRVAWIAALVAAVIPLLHRAIPLVRQAALFRRWWRGQNHGDHTGGNHHRDSTGPMSRDEALAVLGLRPDAGRNQIRTRHRQLMQKLHPDHGGSDYLAAQLNQARSTLLGDA